MKTPKEKYTIIFLGCRCCYELRVWVDEYFESKRPRAADCKNGKGYNSFYDDFLFKDIDDAIYLSKYLYRCFNYKDFSLEEVEEALKKVLDYFPELIEDFMWKDLWEMLHDPKLLYEWYVRKK